MQQACTRRLTRRSYSRSSHRHIIVMSPNYKYRFLSEPATVDVSDVFSRATLILLIYFEPNMRRAAPHRFVPADNPRSSPAHLAAGKVGPVSISLPIGSSPPGWSISSKNSAGK